MALTSGPWRRAIAVPWRPRPTYVHKNGFGKSGHKSQMDRFHREIVAIFMSALFVRSGHKSGTGCGNWGGQGRGAPRTLRFLNSGLRIAEKACPGGGYGGEVTAGGGEWSMGQEAGWRMLDVWGGTDLRAVEMRGKKIGKSWKISAGELDT